MDYPGEKSGIYYYNEGFDRIQNNDMTQAVEFFEKSLMFDSKNVVCMNVLGLCYYMLGLFDRALAVWKTSFTIQQNVNEAGRFIAEMASEDFKSFADAYNRCLDCTEKGEYRKALKYILPYKAGSPYLISVLNITGLLYYIIGLRRHAVKLWKDVLRHDTSNKAAIAYIRDGKTGGMAAAVENLLAGMWEFVCKR